MSAGRAVVSTSLGCEGLAGLEPGRHLLVADEPRAFADAALRLLRRPRAARADGRRRARARRAPSTTGARSATGSSAVLRGRRAPVMHVGLNLVFLVPGRDRRHGDLRPRAAAPRCAALRRRPRSPRSSTARPRAGGTDRGAGSCRWQVVPVAGAQPRRVGARRAAAPAAARAAAGCDLVHSLASTAPLRGRVPRVTTIHDLNYRMVPDAHFGLRGLGMRVLVPAAARRSRRVIVDAASTRDDLVAELGRAGGEDRRRRRSASRRRRRPRADAAARARARFGLGERPVVLSVSAKRPHKNLARLLRALAMIARRAPTRCWSSRAIPLRTRPSCASSRRDLGVERRRGVAGWVTDGGARGPVRRGDLPRVPVALRGLRAAGAGGDGARRAGGHARAGRRCARWQATRRCCSIPRTWTRSAPPSSGSWATGRSANGSRRRGRRAGGRLHLGAHGGVDRRHLPSGALGLGRRRSEAVHEKRTVPGIPAGGEPGRAGRQGVVARRLLDLRLQTVMAAQLGQRSPREHP